jgi:protein-S-isoprenylcysteine O-methyltransferase Ste14
MRAREGEHPWGDTGQLLLLGLFLLVWTVDSFFWRRTTLLAELVPLAPRLILLVLVLAAATLLVRSGHRVIDHESPGAGVVSSGAFRYVRHPLYLGSVLLYLGLALVTASLAALALAGGIFVFYDQIASYEENWLEARHGEAYRSYKSRTGKWWPATLGWPRKGGVP